MKSKFGGDLLPIGALLLLSACPLIRLLALPAFEDEGTELRWIWRAIEAREWLQPLNDGKPLQVWLMTPFVALGLHPLTVMRTMNVFCGMIAAVLMYRVARQLNSDRRIAFTSAALLAICPFAVYLQRLAVTETFLSTAGLWTLLNVLRFVEAPTRRRAILLAASTVLAAFCKFPVGFIFLSVLPLALAMMPRIERRALLTHARANLLLSIVPGVLLAIAVATVVLVQLHQGKQPGFGFSLVLTVGGPHERDIAGVLGVPPMSLITEFVSQLSWPVIAIGIIGVTASTILGDWRQRWLVAIGALPLVALSLAEFWYPRYLLFSLPPLISAAVLGWKNLAQRIGPFARAIAGSALIVCVAFLGRQSALLILDPLAANWSPLDRMQYIEGWSSGYGYPEAAKYLLESHSSPPIYSLDGHSAYQLLVYLPPDWKSRVKPIVYGVDGQVLRTPSARLDNLLRQMPVWIVISKQLLQGYLESSFGNSNLEQVNVRLLAEFKKPGSRAQLALYEVSRRDR